MGVNGMRATPKAEQPYPQSNYICIVVMPYNPDIHHRRSIRLRGYDYAQAGAYFVTICAQGRECLFGRIGAGAFEPNISGAIVGECLDTLIEHFAHVTLDA